MFDTIEPGIAGSPRGAFIMKEPEYFERLFRQDPDVLLIVAELVREHAGNRFQDEPPSVRSLSELLSESQVQATPWCKFENIPVPREKRLLYRVSRHLENGRRDELLTLWEEMPPRSSGS